MENMKDNVNTTSAANGAANNPEYEAASKAYYKSVHKWGQLTLVLGIVFSTFSAVYFGFIKGYFPGWTPILTAFLAIFGVMGHVFFDLPSLITDVLLMGPAAKYMASLTGNVANMRLPSALGAKAAVDCGPAGGPKEHVIASIGVVASTIVNTGFLILMVIAGSLLIKIMPESFQAVLTYILPALFGAIFVQFALMNWKCAATAIVVGVFMLTLFSGVITSSYQAFLSVVLTIGINVLITVLAEKKTKTAG